MKPLSRPSLSLALTFALFGSVLGFLAGKTFVSVPDLRGEVARLQYELNQAKLDRTKSLRRSQLPRTRIQPVRREITESEVSADEQREKLKREVFREGMEAVLARKAADNADLYEPVLQELGLAPEAITQVRSNLVNIHKRAITAGEPMIELARSRDQHDANMRSLLGAEGYQQYRLFEASKPALREYDMLREYALEKRGQQLDPAEAHVIVDLMREAGATTTVTGDGPYDPLPHPVSGTMALEKMEIDYYAVVDNANSLLETAVAGGLAEEELQLLREYYTEKAQRAYDEWVFWSKPFEEREAIIQAETEKGMGPLVPSD